MPPPEPVEPIRCWSCGANRGLVELFDAATEVLCQPVCDGFSVKCPDCREEMWLEFRPGNLVVVAELIGFGARPDLMERQTVRLDGPVEVNFQENTISHTGKVWRYR